MWWGRIIHSFNVGRMPNTVLVFDSYYMNEAGRQGLRVKNVKFIGAVNPQRFPMLTALGVDRRGQWKELWNEKSKDWEKEESTARLPLLAFCKIHLMLIVTL